MKKALSGVARMSRSEGPDQWAAKYGKRKIIQCLLGSQAAPILSAGLDRVSTYGILKCEGSVYVEALFNTLESAALIQTESSGEYPLLKLTETGARVMRGVETIQLQLPERYAGAVQQSTRSNGRPSKTDPTAGVLDQALYAKLTQKRAEIAQLSGKPAYTVFPNFVLVEMANQKPTTATEAIKLRGVGPAKLKTVLPPFLKIIQAHVGE